MRTQLLIPIKPAPKDPEWVSNKMAGKAMDVAMRDEYLKWKHD